MRSKITRGLRLSLVLLLLTVLTPRPASAQWLTTDVPHIGVQLAEFATKAREWAKTIQNYSVVKDAFTAAKVANDISGKIKDISNQVRDLTGEGLALQRQIREDLKKVASIRNLRLSNMTDLRNMAMNLSTLNLANALPSLGQTQRFTQALAGAKDENVTEVSDALNWVSLKRGVRRNGTDTRMQMSTGAMAQLALEQKTQEDYIQQAFNYKKMADDLVMSADEARQATNTEGAMSMTDGERMIAQNNATQMMLQSQEYRSKASELLIKSTQKGPAQLAAEKSILDLQQIAGFNALHKLREDQN